MAEQNQNQQEIERVGNMDETSTSRLERIMGAGSVEKLANSCVMVLGLGGVGSNCAEALARGGVGKLVIMDRDVVAESNINRQAIAFHSTLGKRKVDVVEAMAKDINPNIEIVKCFTFLTRETLPEFWATYGEPEHVDYVVDAIDTVSTKLALAELAQEKGFKLISSMGGGNKLQPECLKITDLSKTVNDPLSRIMRKEARKRGIKKLRVLYSWEEPVKVKAAEGSTRNDRSDLGTASYMPPIMGQMIAGDVIRTLTGVGTGPVKKNPYHDYSKDKKYQKEQQS